MMGTLIGSTIRVMREEIKPVETARIWGGQAKFTCRGRERLDAANPARENVFPGYKEGADVNLKVGVLRIGDIHFASVNGEVYSQIGMRLKAESPAGKSIVVTLGNGAANSGYTYSDDCLRPFDVPGDRVAPQARVRGRPDRFDGPRPDAPIGRLSCRPAHEAVQV